MTRLLKLVARPFKQYKKKNEHQTMLPQLSKGKVYLTDSGLETVLIFQKQRDLREFASFELVVPQDSGKADARDIQLLRDYFEEHVQVAAKHNMGLCVETVTWRASADWGKKLGYDQEGLRNANTKAVRLFLELKKEWLEKYDLDKDDILVSGCVGPKGDGYQVGDLLSAKEYKEYHLPQLKVLKDAGADLLSGITLNNVEEALGMVQAAKEIHAPIVISFTVETDAKLPSGMDLTEAISIIDKATGSYVSYYMINCAHPTHFEKLFQGEGKRKAELQRVKGIRANASKMSHAELDDAEELDDGNPNELGKEIASLCRLHPAFNVLGGCCGTDVRHIQSIAENMSKTKA